MDFLTKLGKHISKLRLYRGFTQAKFAENANVSVSTIGRIEIGECLPEMDTLQKIATTLSVEVEDLFDFDCDISSDKGKEDMISELIKQAKKSNKKELTFYLNTIKEYKRSLQ